MIDWLISYENVVALVLLNGILGIAAYLMLCVNRFTLATGGLVAVGAYVSVIATLQGGLPFPAVLAMGTAAGAIVALLVGLPVLKLEGDYFALATLAFTEVVRVIAFNWDGVTGGALGLDGIPRHTSLALLAAVLAVLVAGVWRARSSWIGRLLEATRQDEMPAQALGIDVARVRLLTFVVSGAVCGLGGGLLGHLNFFISPGDFGLLRSLDAIAYSILGGLNHVLGPVVGALVFTVLPEALRFSAQAREIILSLILLLVIVFLPRGLLSLRVAPGRSKRARRKAQGRSQAGIPKARIEGAAK